MAEQVINIQWPHRLQCALAAWPTFAEGFPIALAGVPHLYEHLVFRRLKRAVNTFGGGHPMVFNARTQPDHFYLHLSMAENAPAIEVIHEALTSTHFDLSESDFREEQQVVIQEINERGQASEAILKHLQHRYLGLDEGFTGITGKIETIANLNWEECRAELERLCRTAKLIHCQQGSAKSEINSLERRTLELKLSVENIPFGKKWAILCVLKADHIEFIDMLRLQILEQVLRYLPNVHTINSIVRERYRASYGFHGLQVPLAEQHIMAWIAYSDRPASKELLEELRSHILQADSWLEAHRWQGVKRLLLEDALFNHPHSLLHILPGIVLRFGSPAGELSCDKRALLEECADFNVNIVESKDMCR